MDDPDEVTDSDPYLTTDDEGDADDAASGAEDLEEAAAAPVFTVAPQPDTEPSPAGSMQAAAAAMGRLPPAPPPGGDDGCSAASVLH